MCRFEKQNQIQTLKLLAPRYLQHKDNVTHEIMEAYHIHSLCEKCISSPSVMLNNKEVGYLASHIS